MTVADLPPELLARILSVDLPSGEYRHGFYARANFLTACCLVSRLWRDLAQPLLYEEVRVLCTRTAPLDRFLQTCGERPDLLVRVRTFAYERFGRGPTRDQPFDKRVLEALSWAKGLEAVYLGSFGLLDLADLQHWPSVRGEAEAFFCPAVLPNLHCISHGYAASFRLDTFPSTLRVISNTNLRMSLDSATTADTTLYGQRFDGFVDALADGAPLASLFGASSSAHIHHLRISDIYYRSSFRMLKDTLSYDPELKNLKTLYLPPEFACRPSKLSEKERGSVQDEEAFWRVMQEKKVQVLSDDTGLSFDEGCSIPVEWRG
ncbi:F-box protein [Rhodotorula paludigena]|uniref:F-box protein n=1 Tax=Rhodotorula paludigena TaxID=86838 RepID=UPI003174009D